VLISREIIKHSSWINYQVITISIKRKNYLSCISRYQEKFMGINC